MLVLTRKRQQSIDLGNGVVITVLEVRGDKVRLGIAGPPDIPIHRLEVYEAVYGCQWTPLRPRSPEEGAFLQAIRDNPGDGNVRLIFADWLEERGDPLGEFIRVRWRLIRLPPGDAQGEALRERARALWTEHGSSWRASLHPIVWIHPSGAGSGEPSA